MGKLRRLTLYHENATFIFSGIKSDEMDFCMYDLVWPRKVAIFTRYWAWYGCISLAVQKEKVQWTWPKEILRKTTLRWVFWSADGNPWLYLNTCYPSFSRISQQFMINNVRKTTIFIYHTRSILTFLVHSS